jgi:hypothetical protein
MRGLRTERTGSVVIRGHAFVQNLRRGHYELAVNATPVFRLATAFENSDRRSDQHGVRLSVRAIEPRNSALTRAGPGAAAGGMGGCRRAGPVPDQGQLRSESSASGRWLMGG